MTKTLSFSPRLLAASIAACAALWSAPSQAGVIDLGPLSNEVSSFVKTNGTLPAGSSFTDYVAFSLATMSDLGGNGVAIQLTLPGPHGGTSNISNLTGQLFSGTAAEVGGADVVSGSPVGQSPNPFAMDGTPYSFTNLASGSYYLKITGTPTGNLPSTYSGIVAVQAVPEPAEWAMMAFGLGLVAFGVSRRRKAALAPMAA